MATSRRIQMMKDTVLYAGANYIAQGIGMINSILLRRFMGPAGMGIWSVLQVILGYCGYANFGTTRALARDYPYYRGKGDFDKADKIKNTTLIFSLGMSVIPALLLLGYYFRERTGLDPVFRYGILFLAAFLFFQRFYDFIMTLLRSEKKFDTLSLLVVLNAAGMLAVTVFLVHRWSVYGMLWGTALVLFICLGFIYSRAPFKFQWRWDREGLKNELKLGIPLMGVAFLHEFLKSFDKLLIAKHMGFQEVGLYSIAMMVNSYIVAAPMMFAHVWYPNLQEAYGEHQNAEKIQHYLRTPIQALSILIPVLSGIAIYTVPVLAQIFIPKFLPGIPAMKMYMVASFFMIVGQLSENFLVTLDKYLLSVPVYLVVIALNYGMISYTVTHHPDLTAVAAVTSLGFVIYGAGIYHLAMKQINQASGKMKEIAVVLGQFFLVYGIAMLIDYLVRFSNPYLAAGVKLAIFGVCSFPFVTRAAKLLGFASVGALIRMKR